MSYCTSRITSPRNESGVEIVVPNLDPTSDAVPSLEVNDAGNVIVSVPARTANVRAEYEVKGTYANNAIWLLRCVNARSPQHASANSNCWVVLVRGTKTIDDAIVDLSLVAAVACNDNAKFDAFLDRRAKQLTLDAFLDHGVRKEHSITIIGHSLGASVVEAMFARLHAAGYKNVNACAFDSPGTPHDLRAKFPNTPWEKLSIVYARDNPVNNLCPAPPRAETYLMYTRDPLELNAVGSWLLALKTTLGLQGVTTLVSPKSLFEHCLGPHSIKCLAKGVERGWISRDENVSARQLSGKLVRAICRLYLSARFTSSATGVAHSDGSKSVPRKRNPKLSTATLEHPEFPGADQALWEYNKERKMASSHNRSPIVQPYSVTDLRNFTRGISPKHDIVIPLIGLTSVGKSSLLKAILELPPEDKTLLVGAKMNVTVTPAVILWKHVESEDGETCRVWLMDLPGVHGSSVTKEDEQSSQFLDVDIPTQLALLSESVQAACFVCGDNVLEQEKRLLVQAHSAVKGRIVVVHNVKGLVDDEEVTELTNEAREECRKALEDGNEGEGAELKIVSVKVARTPKATKAHLASEYGIGSLTEELLRSYRIWKDNIEKGTREKRRAAREARINERADEIEAEMPFFWDGAAAGGTGVGVTAGTGVVGLGTIGVAEGIGAGLALTATGPIVLCAAPFVGTGVGIWMWTLRRRKRREAAIEKAEKEMEDQEQAEDDDATTDSS